MRLFDCFTFFNEIDLLELRLRELDAQVHRFVLVEGAQTFTGRSKPLHFMQNRERFAAFLHKIEHVVLEDFPSHLQSAWDREYLSRRAIMRGLGGARPDDLVLISDVDEIPKPAALAEALENAGHRLTVFESERFMYYLNLRSPHLSVVQSPRLLARRHVRDPQAVRSMKPYGSKDPIWGRVTALPIIRRARAWIKLGHALDVRVVPCSAWHFSYLGGAESIRDKMLAFSHTEGVTADNTDVKFLTRALQARQGIFGETELREAPIDGLPQTVQSDRARWQYCMVTSGPV